MPSLITFNTTEVHLWNRAQQETSMVIDLPQTYVAPPTISVGLNSLDVKAGTGVRVTAFAGDIDNRKFTANVNTWANTTLWSGGINCFVMRPANLDFLSGEFATAEVETSERINFKRPFATPPNVVVFLRQLDVGEGSCTRVTAYATDIDAKGFTIHVDTSSDTKLRSGIAGWIAYPEDKENIYSGTANTFQVRPMQNVTPGAVAQKYIDFNNTAFYATPSVFVALNTIDCSTAHDLRVNAYSTDISTRGMTWHIDSWSDTILYSAGISFIAFN
ncbi:hypothetical protein FRB90_003992 [Tulasnella sp. 427]|nr:hypothetical protein FRB90_003992 [Tulasnella sp. 427]